MKKIPLFALPLLAAAVSISAFLAFAQSSSAASAPATSSTPAPSADAAKPYKIIQTTQVPSTGGLDYVTADSVNRRVFVASGSVVHAFDLDTFKEVGTLPNASGHGVALDPEDHTGLVSGPTAVLFNTQTLQPIKTGIPAARADGYVYDAFTHHFIISTHGSPNLHVIDAKDGSVITTVDKIGPDDSSTAVEQGVSDGAGMLYFCCEDKNCLAVVDAKTLKVTTHYLLGDKGVTPAGLGLDNKNHILFAMCRGNATSGGPTCVILSATDGKIITTLPLAGGSDGGGFNPNTMEAFSSTGNDGKGSGALSIIKEKSPTEFVLLETITTKSGAKTCTVDTKLNHIIVITNEAAPAPAAAPAGASASAPAASVAPPVASATPAAASASGSAAASPGSAVAAAAAGPRGSAGRAGGARAGAGRGGPQVLDVIFVGR